MPWWFELVLNVMGIFGWAFIAGSVLYAIAFLCGYGLERDPEPPVEEPGAWFAKLPAPITYERTEAEIRGDR